VKNMRYLLIDANHLASRCRHAGSGRTLSRSDGLRTGVVYGVLRGTSWAKKHLQIDNNRVICLWDGGRAAGRMEMYPGYKSGRTKENPTPEELDEKKSYYEQISHVRRGLKHVGIRQVCVPGVEADDLISIFTTMYCGSGDEVTIYSGDQDMHQLVSSQVSILHSEKDILRVDQILEHWKLPTIQLIPICKALSGDSSDSIAGVPRIGEKRAALVAPYQHLIFSDCDQPDDVTDEVWQWVEVARSHVEIISRNLKLMALPRSWSESFYTAEQAVSAIEQMHGPDTRRSMREFIAFCREWELASILENLHHW